MSEAARRVGVHKQTWFRWEHGKSSPSADMITQIAEALETTPTALQSDRPLQVSETPEEFKVGNPPDTVQGLTAAMTRWTLAWTEGQISERQKDEAIDLIIRQMKALIDEKSNPKKTDKEGEPDGVEKRAIN